MSNAVTKSNIAVVHEKWQAPEFKEQIRGALPQKFDTDRFMRIAWSMVRSTKDLPDCTSASIQQSVVKAAQLGLEPLLGMVYLVPYKNNKTKTTEAQCIIGYRGMLELARRSEKVAAIWAHVVFEGDVFEREYGLHQNIKHIPVDRDKRGPLKAAYAVAKLIGSDEPVFIVLDKEDIMKRKKVSRGSDSDYSPWQQWPEEMWKKTAMRALFPLLPVAVETQAAVAQEEREEMIIDIDAEEIPSSLDDIAEKYTEAESQN